MIQSIDHIVILVTNLEQAIDDYTALGFRVMPGGEHTGGLSHNALIAFEDGSYLELIAFRGPIPPDHLFYREGVTEGLITYALLPTDIEADVAAARTRGLNYEGPRPGGRLKPDGTRIEWQIATPSSYDLPFLCGDVTPRDLRVPTGNAQKHENGVTGINTLTLCVKNLRESIQKYSALLGEDPYRSFQGEPDHSSKRVARFRVGESGIMLNSPGTPGKVREGANALGLQSSSAHLLNLDQSRTHGVPLLLVPKSKE